MPTTRQVSPNIDAAAPAGARRPLKSRDVPIWHRIAAHLAGAGVTPNAISATSVVFAAIAGGSFALAGHSGGTARVVVLVAAAVCIQLRLAGNLLDGLVAVEHGRADARGPIWNELPDRFSDVFVLVGAGSACHVAHGMDLAWAAAVGAVLTAYVRAFAGSVGATEQFVGPMAKPQRMALLTIAALVTAVVHPGGRDGVVLAIALGIVAVGTLVTVAVRVRRLAHELDARATATT